MMFVGSEKALDDKKKILLIFFLCEILLVFDDNLGFLGNYMQIEKEVFVEEGVDIKSEGKVMVKG